jgi:hypothetical protein
VGPSKHSLIVRGSEGVMGRRKGRKSVRVHTKVSAPEADFGGNFHQREIVSEGAERANLNLVNAHDGFGNQL